MNGMFGIGRGAALTIAATALGAGLLGSVALGALTPLRADTFTSVPDRPGTTTPANAPAGDGLKGILDGLVAKGVITQAQEDAILGAVGDARGKDGRAIAKLFADLLKQSAGYLGVTPAELKAKLPGTSLAAIANATPGRSRDGLVAALDTAVRDAIAKALAGGTITQEQADRATAAAPQRIAAFVDRVWPQRLPPSPKLPSALSFIGNLSAAARDYLGLSRQDLAQQLRDGRSLADIANATPGKSRDGLVAAITSAADARIDQAQAGGKLTADQAAQLKTRVGEMVARFVDQARPGSLKGAERRQKA